MNALLLSVKNSQKGDAWQCSDLFRECSGGFQVHEFLEYPWNIPNVHVIMIRIKTQPCFLTCRMTVKVTSTRSSKKFFLIVLKRFETSGMVRAFPNKQRSGKKKNPRKIITENKSKSRKIVKIFLFYYPGVRTRLHHCSKWQLWNNNLITTHIKITTRNTHECVCQLTSISLHSY